MTWALLLLTKNRLPTDFNVYISKRTGKMRRLFWDVDAYCFRNSFLRKLRFTMLIFEFILQSFCHWNLSKIIYFNLFSCSGDVLHHFWWFWKFSEIFIFGAPASFFWGGKMSHIGFCHVWLLLVFVDFLFKTSYKFILLGTTSGIPKDIQFIFQFWNLGPSTTYFSFGLDFPSLAP